MHSITGLSACVETIADETVQNVAAKDLEEGDILAEALHSARGILLASRGTRVSATLLRFIENAVRHGTIPDNHPALIQRREGEKTQIGHHEAKP